MATFGLNGGKAMTQAKLISGLIFFLMSVQTSFAQESTPQSGPGACVSVDTIDEWRAYDDDTMSVYGGGNELARIDIPVRGTSDTWIMHSIHKVRFEAGDDGLLCPESSDTLVLDGRRHFIEKIVLIEAVQANPIE